MTELHQDVKDWLHKQADWLQQSTDLLLTKGALDEADISALAEHLKTAEGKAVTITRTYPELEAGTAQEIPIRLKSIGDIQGIENLGPRTPLDFGTGNLCVIYGNNGSGKSGYTRLLKKVSGKPGAKDLKHNVFKAPPNERKCKIGFHDGADRVVEWIANAAPIEALRSVDIFDADTATTYLTKESESSYTPPLVSLFERLITVVGRVKEQLQGQQTALVNALPPLPQQYVATKSGAQYNGLRANTLPAEVQKIRTWTEVEEQELTQITERLAAADPAALARQKRATKTQVEQIANQIKTAALAYTSEALDSIRVKRHDAQAKRKIAQEAAQVQSAKLEGVGSDTWKALWEAARAYSQTPYPELDFPVVDEARCVLCQQDLAEDAKQRLQDFEMFVQGDVEKAAITAENSFKVALAQLPVALTEQIVTERYQAAGLIDEAMLAEIHAFWGKIGASLEAMQTDELAGDAAIVAVPQSVIDSLTATAVTLEAQAVQHGQDVDGFNRVEVAQKKVELEAKKWTSQQAQAITAEMDRLKKHADYDGWIKGLNTQHITIKGGQVAETAITEAYVSRFNDELKHLGAVKIRVKLVKTQAVKGRALHGLQLENSLDATAKPHEVLSEGERRIIGLAAFFADVTEKPNASTFIFDDPISSLDQDFELAVGKRLVQLARTRQVLVFTHRLSLYVALESEAKKMGAEWEKEHHVKKWIESYSGVAGQTAEESMRNVNTTKANNILITKIGDAKRKGEVDGAGAYKELASGLCSEFRILLERTVENDLLNSIVLRHRNSVTTDNKLSSLTKITPEDCHMLDELMTKYSTLVHSQSTENPIDIPEEPELKSDFDKLKNWRDGFRDRQVPS